MSLDGETIYIDNIGEGHDKVMYKYDVRADRLTKVRIKNPANIYQTEAVSNKAPHLYDGVHSATVGIIDEETFAYLVGDSEWVKDLRVVVFNEKNHNNNIYSIFYPEVMTTEIEE